MLQVLVKRGRIVPTELSPPRLEPGSVLVKTVRSCVSAGTELAELAKAAQGVVAQAVRGGGAVRKLWTVLRTEGPAAVSDRISGRRDIGDALGYSAAGIVLAAGEAVAGVRPGDRVAAAGTGFANHAEIICVPRSMVHRLPDAVSFDAASTVALGAIALHAVRRSAAAVGELVVVYGAGAIGQLAVQILASSGARVIAVDLDPARLATASSLGAEAAVNPREQDVARAVRDLSGGYGADAVLYCASGADRAAMSACAAACRRKGRLVLVGTWSGGLERSDLYARELDLLVSTSYGPGRYDERYESDGVDYPHAYVRWTEGRNMAEYLRLLASRKVVVEPLVDLVCPVQRADEAFRRLGTAPRPLLVLLDYGTDLPRGLSALAPRGAAVNARDASTAAPAAPRSGPRKIRVGLIGAGRFATGMHLPNLRALSGRFELAAVCCRTGTSSMAAARKFDAGYAGTDYREMLADPAIDLVIVCTRAELHAALALDALRAGKAVLVEKPLCVTAEELRELDRAVSGGGSPMLTVGFNRRFSPAAVEMRAAASRRTNPLFLRYRMNAGAAAWSGNDLEAQPPAGGRIVGEACHAVDLASFLCGSRVRAYGSAHLRPATTSMPWTDSASIALEYEDGSVAVVDYFGVGSPELPKESIEVHFDGRSLILDNFQELAGYGVKVKPCSSREPRKGHREELEAAADFLQERRAEWPISWECIRETTEITLALEGRLAAAEAAAAEDAGARSSPDDLPRAGNA